MNVMLATGAARQSTRTRGSNMCLLGSHPGEISSIVWKFLLKRDDLEDVLCKRWNWTVEGAMKLA